MGMRRSICRVLVCLYVAAFAFTAGAEAAHKPVGPRMGVKKMKAVPELGSRIKPVAPLFKAFPYCVVGSAHLYHCFIAVVDGISYRIAYVKNAAGKNEVQEVRTVDPHFKTPGGLSVGNLVIVKSANDLVITPLLAFDGHSDGDWHSILGEIPGPVIVVGPDGKDSWIGYDDLHFNGQPVQLKISGFVLGNQTQIAANNDLSSNDLPIIDQPGNGQF